MEDPTDLRIDKWLWAVRLYKTRGLAATACRNGHVTIGAQTIKPSRSVKLHEVICAKTGDITRTVKVRAFTHHRISPKAVPDFLEDLTPPSEYAKPREPRFTPTFSHSKGKARPTKKDRRVLSRFFS